MDNEKIIKLQHFFLIDLQVKKEIYNLVPPNEGQYLDENSICIYTDKLNASLEYIFTELKCITLDLFGYNTDIYERICYLEEIIKREFYNCGLDINKLRIFYEKYISNMELDFINSVKEECIGYSIYLPVSISKANSINEVLHFIHSFILNNEKILQSIPLINQKKNDFNYTLSLRGIKNPFFEQLFNLFPTNLECDCTDMVAISDKKLIMMVRDRGHALSIEITLNTNNARIEYFIPRICNVEMVNKLPGINKVNDDSVGATGIIEIPISELPVVLFDFISKVPTDDDKVETTKRI